MLNRRSCFTTLIPCNLFEGPHTFQKTTVWWSTSGRFPFQELSGTGKVSKIYEYVLSAPSLMEFLQLSKHSRKVSVLISLPSMRSLGQVKK